MKRLLLVLLLSTAAWTQCISIADAPQHIGKKKCVAGKVLRITESKSGVVELHFCAEGDACPFLVRVFPVDFDYVGDLRQFVGKQIEITGKIRERNHQAQMVLKDADQLNGESAELPPIPRTYDVERRGNFSPGQFKGSRTTRRSQKRPATGPDQEIDEE